MVYIIVFNIKDYNHYVIMWILYSLDIGLGESDGFISFLTLLPLFGATPSYLANNSADIC